MNLLPKLGIGAILVLVLVTAGCMSPTLRRLQSSDPAVREQAVRELAWRKTPGAAEALREVLRNDESWAVREKAACVLGLNLDPSAVKPLMEVLSERAKSDTPEDVLVVSPSRASLRAAAAESLGIIGDNRATEVLLKTIQEKWNYNNADITDQARNAAREALVSMCDPKAFDTMVRLLESQEQRNRYCAVRYLRELGDARAVKPIISMLDNSRDPDYYKRPYTKDIGAIQFDYDYTEDIFHEAFSALAEMGSKEAVEPLLEFLLKPEKNTLPTFAAMTVETYAIETLGLLGDERAIGPLVEQLDDDAIDAARALLEIGTPEATARALAKILELLQKEDKGNHILALEVLAKVDKPRAVSKLSDIMKKSQDKDTRYEAAVALGLLGETGALETLKAMLYDKEYYWNEKAFQTLLRIDHPRVVPVFIEKLKNVQDIWDKTEVAKALALIGDKQAAGALLEAFKICEAVATERSKSGWVVFDDEKPEGDMAAILAKFPTPEVIEALEREKEYCNSMDHFALAWIRGGKDLKTSWNRVTYKDWFQDYARARWGDLAALHNVIMGFHERTDPSEFDWKDEAFAPDIFLRMPEGFPEYDRKAPFDTKVRQAKAIRTWYRKYRHRLAWDEEKRRYYLREEQRQGE